MLLGYTIIYPDTDAFMLSEVKLDECAKYSNVYDLNIIDPNFKVPKRAKNISATYDGYTIVSEKFKAFCETGGYTGVEFLSLPGAPGFYWFRVHNILVCDVEARGTEFLNYSEKCKGYEEIIGITPICLKDPKVLEDRFYRTDLFAGSFERKSPTYMVGKETKKKLVAAGFREIYFQKIQDRYSWQEEEAHSRVV